MSPAISSRLGSLSSKSPNAFLCASLLSSVFALACAAPGQPTPPHPPVPVAISDLMAHQRGSSVVLSFTVPAKSTRGDKLTAAPSIEIYRTSSTPNAIAAPNFQLVQTLPSNSFAPDPQTGRADVIVPLPAGAPAGQPLTFSIRTSVAKKRVSADSNFVTLSVFPAPPAPTDLHAEVTESAIELRWSGAAAGYSIYRCESAPSTNAQVQSCTPAFAKKIGDSSAPSFNDTQFTFGATYLYIIRALAAAGSSQIESDDSAPLAVTPIDIFPPAPPSGLVASVIPATESTPARVELSWEISPETDLAGYYVYRSDGQGSTGQRLTPRLLLAPVFRDITAVAGQKYLYRVSAVDRAGNESKLSSPVEVDVPQQ